MQELKFEDIPVMDFGNEYTIAGILFKGHNNEPLIVTLPQENIQLEPRLVPVTLDEWNELMQQLDYNNVEGIRGEQKVILRKSQRNVDSKISWTVFRRDNYACRYCGIDHVPLTVDHIITWETGGTTSVDNLLTSCKQCNNTRGNLSYDKWLQTDYYKEKSKFLSADVIINNKRILEKLDSMLTTVNVRRR